MLVSIHEMVVNMGVDRDSICIQESARAILGTMAMDGGSDSHQGGSVWFSFT